MAAPPAGPRPRARARRRRRRDRARPLPRARPARRDEARPDAGDRRRPRGRARLRSSCSSASGRATAILGEEQGARRARAGGAGSSTRSTARGTSSRGIPVWATLIALEEDGELTVGVASAPALDRRWWARARRRSVRGRRPRSTSPRCARIEDAVVSYAALDERAPALARDAWHARGFGDFWQHVLVAEGAVDAAIDRGVDRGTWPRPGDRRGGGRTLHATSPASRGSTRAPRLDERPPPRDAARVARLTARTAASYTGSRVSVSSSAESCSLARSRGTAGRGTRSPSTSTATSDVAGRCVSAIGRRRRDRSQPR